MMARLNVSRSRSPVTTHEGAPAVAGLTPEQQLRRTVLSCLLWEREFYEDGEEIATRIARLAAAVPPLALASLAVEARTTHNLRHVPLLLLSVLIETGRGSRLVADTIALVIQRADEPAELLSMYWRNGRKPLAAQLRKGLARALGRFDAYQLAKYRGEGDPVRLRDVMFLVRPKPRDDAQAEMWRLLANDALPPADTWETALSGGKDKRETFERLLRENRIGYLALLRNLRNMEAAGVDADLIRDAILARRGGAQRVLPFRYVAAARACPRYEPCLDGALREAIAEQGFLDGETIVLVDVSGSMDERLSGGSGLTRMDAAAALASLISGRRRVFTVSDSVIEVPPRPGMAGVDAVVRSQPHNGTLLGAAVAQVNALPHDRLIVVSDEQSQDPVPRPAARRAYMINPASARNGIGYRNGWTHFDGFSEAVLRFITETERAAVAAAATAEPPSTVPDGYMSDGPWETA